MKLSGVESFQETWKHLDLIRNSYNRETEESCRKDSNTSFITGKTTMGLPSSNSSNFNDYEEPSTNTCAIIDIYLDYNVGAVYYVSSALGILFNLVVLLVFLLHKNACNVPEIYLCNLAAADFLQMFFQIFWAVYISNQLIWPFGDRMCKIVSLSTTVNYNCSMFFLFLVSIDRYLALVHPLLQCKMRSQKYAKLICLLVWISGFLLGIPTYGCRQVRGHRVTVQYNETFTYETVKHLCVFSCSKNVNIANEVLQIIFPFIIPMLIVCFCTVEIVRALNRHQRKITSTQKIEKKATILVLVVLFTFLILRLPFNVARGLEDSCWLVVDIKYHCTLLKNVIICKLIFKYLASFHSVLNPVLYVMVGKNFREKMWEVFTRSPATTNQS